MALPTMTCRIAFATAPFAATPTWSDISSDLLSFSIRRGRQHALDRVEAGTATIILNNSNGNYWPGSNLLSNGDFEVGDPPTGWDDAWTVTKARSSEQVKIGTYSIKLTSTSASYPSGASQDLANPTYYRSRSVTFGAWVYATSANRVQLQFYPNPEYSSCHSGVAGWEWLTVTAVIPSDATMIRGILCITAGAVISAYFDGAILVEGDYLPSRDYFTYVLPGKRINLRTTYGAAFQPDAFQNDAFLTIYDIFTGFIESYTPRWLTKGGIGPVMVIEGIDVSKNLALLLLNNAGYSQELSGTRIDNVLAALSANIGHDLDAGQSYMQATGALVNANAMSHLFTVQWSEAGYIFAAGDGDVQFHDRHARLKGNYVTSQAIFGDDAGENRYTDIEFSYDDDYIYNDVRITRSGGVEQTASDATSQTSYGQRSLSRTGLLMTSDAEAQSQANYFIKRYKDPAMRVKSITIMPDREPANLYPKILSYDIGTRITVRLNQTSIDEDYHIEGIQHDCDASRGYWTTKWQLSPADPIQYWVLGIAGFSELGQTTYLCY